MTPMEALCRALDGLYEASRQATEDAALLAIMGEPLVPLVDDEPEPEDPPWLDEGTATDQGLAPRRMHDETFG